MPNILEELGAPAEGHSRPKAKRKSKINGKRPHLASKSATPVELHAECSADSTGEVVGSAPSAGVSPASLEAQPAPEADQAHADESKDAAPVPSLDLRATDVAEGHCADACLDAERGPWMQVGRKGVLRADAVDKTEPAERPLTPVGSAATPLTSKKPVAPIFCQVSAPGPLTPASACPSTPSATTSPFGLRTVLPLWPSTPEFWAGLPPATLDEDAGSLSFQGPSDSILASLPSFLESDTIVQTPDTISAPFQNSTGSKIPFAELDSAASTWSKNVQPPVREFSGVACLLLD